MGDYWHKAWSCPFFGWSKEQEVRCEGGVQLPFPDQETAVEYMNHYCAGRGGEWRKCSIASSLLRYYDRKDTDDEAGNQ